MHAPTSQWPSHVLMYLPNCLKLWKVKCTPTACACTNYRFTIVSAWIRLFSGRLNIIGIMVLQNVVTWERSHARDFHITIILVLQANEYTHPTKKRWNSTKANNGPCSEVKSVCTASCREVTSKRLVLSRIIVVHIQSAKTYLQLIERSRPTYEHWVYS